MSEDLHVSPTPAKADERRVHTRQTVRSLAYVELGERNGGILLNLSEGGMAVKAAMGLTNAELPRVRFQLTQTRQWIETRGRISWAGETRKTAGVQFIDLPEEAAAHIREWVSLENSSTTLPLAALPAPVRASERAQQKREPVFHREKEKVHRQEEKIDEHAVDLAIEMALRAVKKSAKARPELVRDQHVLPTPSPIQAEAPSLEADLLPVAESVSEPFDEPVRERSASEHPSNAALPAINDPAASPASARSTRARPPISVPFSGHFGALPNTKEPKRIPPADPAENTARDVPAPVASRIPISTASPAESRSRIPNFMPPHVPLRPPTPPSRVWIFVGASCFLAVVSLLSGWVAGRGTLDEILAKITGKTSDEPPAADSDSPAADAASNVAQIEIMDANNNRRTIPLSGPTPGQPNGGSGSANARMQRDDLRMNRSDPVPAPDVNSTTGMGAFASPQPSRGTESVNSSRDASSNSAEQASQERVLRPATAQSSSGGSSAPTLPIAQDSVQQPPRSPGMTQVQRAELVHWVEPAYPQDALDQGVQGTVRLHVIVDAGGAVTSVQPLSGPQLLIPAAVAAVQQWRYKPFLLDGKRAESSSDISVVFTIPAKPR